MPAGMEEVVAEGAGGHGCDDAEVCLEVVIFT